MQNLGYQQGETMTTHKELLAEARAQLAYLGDDKHTNEIVSQIDVALAQPEQEPDGLAAYVIGCFRAAQIEGLQEALDETTDERLKDLVERRLMYALYEAQEPQPKKPEQEPVAWTDRKDEWTDEIAAHHPMKTKAYKQWDTAMAMVGARHSKSALVELVCWLLQKSSPPQRKPLTDEQADGVALDVMGFAVLEKEQAETALMLIRATEAAHGIKGDV